MQARSTSLLIRTNKGAPWTKYGITGVALMLAITLVAGSVTAASPVYIDEHDERLSWALLLQHDEDLTMIVDPHQREPGDAVDHVQLLFLEENTLLPNATSTSALAQFDRADQIDALANEAASFNVDRNAVSQGSRNGEGLLEQRSALEDEVVIPGSERRNVFHAKMYGEELEERHRAHSPVNDVIDMTLGVQAYRSSQGEHEQRVSDFGPQRQ